MNGVQTRFKCKLDVKRCKRFVFPPSSLLPRSNTLKTKAIRYFQTDRTLTRIVSPPLYSPKELVEWDQEINHATDGDSQESYLCLDSDVAKDLYGDEIDSDWRFNYQLEEKYYGYYYRTLKYYKQTENKDEGKISNRTLPMIRMSEVYYIAAEAIFDTNPKEAQGYLELVKKGRGISKKFDNVTNKSEFINLLVNDARREFLGEGQIFYMYKRLNRLMPASSFYDSDVLPTDENMVLPKPDSESNI